MHLTAECLESLKCRAFWENTDTPSLKKFLEFRFLAGDLEFEEIEHSYYKHDLNTIGSHYAEVSEVGRKVLKWKQRFKASLPCSITNYPAGAAGSGKGPVLVGEHIVDGVSVCSVALQRTTLWCGSQRKGPNDKNSKSIRRFWVLQVNRQSKLVESQTAQQISELVTNQYHRCKATKSESSDTESVMSNDDDDSEYDEDAATRPSTNECNESSVTRTSFVKTYMEMDHAHKWTLLSGIVVEDVIFSKYKDVDTESLAHSWVIDLDDDEMASLFCHADWLGISSRTLALPQLETLTVKSMSRFAGVTMTAELRNVLEMTTY
ncbi:hypothetical protein BC936DRAFT_148205 [Jimgerdemannia flammicorona]|uniref:Uncharacterized protein n=1 Tax=Jimgerdemannia flammicorona TaxID=994334 RepID=A0A433D3L6_9FUNG|nr:hypothetical protein BC936DRAFT_148205 [Jimgerdemannia flammicorona]